MRTLMSISDGLDWSSFCLKVERKPTMREEMDGRSVFFRQSEPYYFDVILMKVLLPIGTLTCQVNNYVSRQGKGEIRRKEETKAHKKCYEDIDQDLFFRKLDCSIFSTSI